MTHSLPWKFQVGSGESKQFATVDQVVTTTDKGRAEISKGGASNHSEFRDPDERDPLF